MKNRKRRGRQRPEKQLAAPAVPLALAKPSVPGWETGVMETALIKPGSTICIIDSDGEGAEMLLSTTTNVVVQRRSTGQLEIFFSRGVFDHNSRRDVIKTLRIREREKTNKKGTHRYNWRELSTMGLLDGWHYNEMREIISNRDPVTRLTVGEVVDILKLALDSRDFDLERSRWCQQGFCHNREWDQCPLYRFGLARCVAVRKTEAAAQKPEAPEAEEEPIE